MTFLKKTKWRLRVQKRRIICIVSCSIPITDAFPFSNSLCIEKGHSGGFQGRRLDKLTAVVLHNIITNLPPPFRDSFSLEILPSMIFETLTHMIELNPGHPVESERKRNHISTSFEGEHANWMPGAASVLLDRDAKLQNTWNMVPGSS